ncbi:pectinesterase/pectinesterase inhibitor PPE8B [Trifolium repens]|nr:pectinesterase/pectinesterase inhibitor PPE8B [Trifolium repens]
MATNESLLDKPRKSIPKTFWLILSLVAIISSSALIVSHLNKPNSFLHLSSAPNVCQHALDTKSCLDHVSEVIQGATLVNTKDQNLHVLLSLLTKSTTHMQKAMNTANVIKRRINSPREEIALNDCEKLMDLSMDRVWDSVLAMTNSNIDSEKDAHTWLSSVLTNHATCLDGLEGISLTLMETDIQEMISRARTSLAVFLDVFPQKGHDEFVDEKLNGEFPSWVTSKSRRLLESYVGDIKANVIVATDGSGNFKTVAEGVASAPDNGKTIYVIYVKKGTYKENIEIGKKKTNVMLVGDGMDATIITGNLNFIDGTTTFKSATVAAVGDRFIAQDIWFQNTAGPEKHQAVALRVGADQSVINRCRIDAFQDTLYAHSNRQFYRDSVITGQNTGTSIQQCNLTPSDDLKPVVGSIKTFLGRPWKKFSRTVVLQSFLDSHIDPTGWSEWDAASKDFLQTLYYGEYMNNGPGAGTGKRVTWPGYHIITDATEASKFTVAQLIQGNVWLKNSGVAFTEGL